MLLLYTLIYAKLAQVTYCRHRRLETGRRVPGNDHCVCDHLSPFGILLTVISQKILLHQLHSCSTIHFTDWTKPLQVHDRESRKFSAAIRYSNT